MALLSVAMLLGAALLRSARSCGVSPWLPGAWLVHREGLC